LQVVCKDGARIEVAIAVAIFEDQNSVAQLQVIFFRRLGVGVVLRDPKAPATVPRHGDGILHIRFRGEHGGFKPVWQLQLSDRFPGG
jgi:hypothetical protein